MDSGTSVSIGEPSERWGIFPYSTGGQLGTKKRFFAEGFGSGKVLAMVVQKGFARCKEGI